jgi:protoporphyrinogen/coproporphyrinogen III oxidase
LSASICGSKTAAPSRIASDCRREAVVTSRVVVAGAGVAGLTVAHRLVESGLDDVRLVESADRVGGRLATVRVGDLELDAGADSFVARKPWAGDLCRELRLPLEQPGESGAFLWTDEGLMRFLKDSAFGIPGDVGDVFRWPGLSPAGRRRAAQDLVRKKRKSDDEESLGELLRRRLGDEATERAIAPLLAGLFAGDVDALGVRGTFPELDAWEREQGSLIRGSQAARRTAARLSDAGPVFARPRGGPTALTDALAARLGARVRTRERLDALPTGTDADAVVVATPASDAARILGEPRLAEIRYVSTAVVFLVYGDGTQPLLPDGTGFVVPRGAAPFTACTFVSSKWPDPGRFGSRAVLRCYVGAAGDEDVLDESDGDIVEACAKHLAAVLPLPERPVESLVHRWPASMPQYAVGHLERVRRIRDALPPGIFVCGNAYDGIGIADTVRGANETAEHVLAHLGVGKAIT